MKPQVKWLTLGLLVALVPGVAGAQAVYKCEKDGKLTYTDRPCEAGAQAAVLPFLVVTAPPSAAERALADAHDGRIARGQAERDRDDEAWLKEHARARDRAERVRKAIIGHKVIKGMTAAEVRQSLGEPDEVARSESFGSDKETWTYEGDGEKRTVNFKDAQVTTTSSKQMGSKQMGSKQMGARRGARRRGH